MLSLCCWQIVSNARHSQIGHYSQTPLSHPSHPYSYMQMNQLPSSVQLGNTYQQFGSTLGSANHLSPSSYSPNTIGSSGLAGTGSLPSGTVPSGFSSILSGVGSSTLPTQGSPGLNFPSNSSYPANYGGGFNTSAIGGSENYLNSGSGFSTPPNMQSLHISGFGPAYNYPNCTASETPSRPSEATTPGSFSDQITGLSQYASWTETKHR
ncbi:hypothetical protein Avbf_05933 [Armadillidium vulgare]|nr:hypothetical protein Avbf_05933 [Armadillidium vulgare]